MEELKKKLNDLIAKIDLEQKKAEIMQINRKSQDPHYWKDHQKASAEMQRLSSLQKEIDEVEMLRLYLEEGDEKHAREGLEKLSLKVLLSGKYDQHDAILAIHAGQGGTEAMDWASILLRMYTRYAQTKKWKYEIVEETPGEEAGIKTASLIVKGFYAYGYLKAESGVHRLVRQSPFNADNLRQTSFALVEVWPVIDDDPDIKIKDDDIIIETYRASSKGGQNVNKVETAVRIRHIPSGLVVASQTQRYQAQNRENALKLLKSKLWELKEIEKAQKEKELKGGYKKPGWGNQIRSYVLHPYHMVKDLRTDYETSDTQMILNGKLDPVIESYLKKFTDL